MAMLPFTIRSMALRQSIIRPAVITTLPNTFQARTYVDSQPDRRSTSRSGPAATNARDSPSASPESSQVNSSRGAEHVGGGSPGAAASSSVQTPVSNPSESGLGQQKEQHEVKPDSSEPAEQKREKVLSQGDTPLDPADKAESQQSAPSDSMSVNRETQSK